MHFWARCTDCNFNNFLKHLSKRLWNYLSISPNFHARDVPSRCIQTRFRCQNRFEFSCLSTACFGYLHETWSGYVNWAPSKIKISNVSRAVSLPKNTFLQRFPCAYRLNRRLCLFSLRETYSTGTADKHCSQYIHLKFYFYSFILNTMANEWQYARVYLIKLLAYRPKWRAPTRWHSRRCYFFFRSFFFLHQF